MSKFLGVQLFCFCNRIIGFIFLSLVFNGFSQNNRVLNNTSFEQPVLGGFAFVNENNVDGWLTTDPSRQIEFWVDGKEQDGRQYVELNSHSRAALYQDICMVQGETFQWSFWHRARAVGIDSMVLLIDGVEQGRFGSSNVAWENYTGSYTLNAPSKVVRFQFEALTTASGNTTIGNFLDNITISGLKAFVYFDPDSTSTLERVGGTPYLLLNGRVISNSQIDVVVTGGDATKGTDYTLTSIVVIPAGDYDGTIKTGIAVPLNIIDDSKFEPDETVSLKLVNPVGSISLGTACVPVATTVDFTIINDDCDNGKLKAIYPDSVCVGETFDVTIDDSEGKNLLWTVSNATSTVSGVNNIKSSIEASDKTISIKVVQDISMCPKDTVFDVFIFKDKSLTVDASPKEVCEGDSVLVTANGLNSYVWDNGLKPLGSQYIIPSTSTTYKVKGTYGRGCEKEATVSVVVNANPIISFDPILDICKGDSVVVTAKSNVSSDFLWIKNNLMDISSTIVNNPIVKPDTTTEYFVKATTLKGCIDTTSVKVVVNELPDVRGIVSQDTVCKGDSIILTGANAKTYVWNHGVINAQFFTPDISKTYTVKGIDVNNCENTYDVIVTVMDNPIPSVSIEYDDDACEGEEIVFTIKDSSNLGVGATYKWLKNKVDIVGTAEMMKLSTLQVGDEIQLEVISKGVCVLPANRKVLSNVVAPIIYKKPELNLSDLLGLCSGESGSLTVTDAANIAKVFTFYDDKNEKVAENTSGVIAIDESNSSSFYYVLAKNPNRQTCMFRSNDGFVSYIDPFVDLSISKNVVKKGTEIQVDVNTNVTTFEWSTNPLGISDTTNLVLYDNPEENKFYVFKGQINGCYVSDSVEVNVLSPFSAPYLFSPNGDGNNDVWVLEELSGYNEYTVVVYNRWGNVVKSFTDNFDYWDGKGEGGEDLPDGVYYYVIEASVGEEVEAMSGYVTIVK